MKKLMLIFVVFTLFAFKSEAKPLYGGGVSFSFFYSSLNPYGEWIQIDNDLIVWRPSAGVREWRPYSAGRWIYTSDGWYWDSDEPFGWATYHYGRWYFDDYYGWVWIPGYEWAPAWVEWRYNDYYIGWAPLPPYASFRIDIGIHFSIRWHSHYDYWNFVPYNRFCGYEVHNYFVNPVKVRRFFRTTKYRTNYYENNGRIYNGGISRSYIEKRSGSAIREREINTSTRLRDYTNRGRDSKNGITVYRPSEEDVKRSRDVRTEFKRDVERKSSLSRDRISINRENSERSEAKRNDVRSRIEKYFERDGNSDRSEYNRERKSTGDRNIYKRDTREEKDRNPVFKRPERSKTNIFNRSERKPERKTNIFERKKSSVERGKVQKRENGGKRSRKR